MAELGKPVSKSKYSKVEGVSYAMAEPYNEVHAAQSEAFEVGTHLSRHVYLSNLQSRRFIVLSPCARLDTSMYEDINMSAREVAELYVGANTLAALAYCIQLPS